MATDKLSQHAIQDSMKRTKQANQLNQARGTGMNKRKVWFWIGGGLVLVIAGLLVGALGMLGFLPWQSGNLYEDPQGRFSMQIGPSWEQVETDGSYAQFKVPDPPTSMYLLVLKADTVDEAFAQAFEVVGFDPGLLGGDSVTTFGDWQAYQQADAEGINYGLVGQIVGGNAYVMIVKGDNPGVSPENANLLRALASLKIAGKEEIVIESYADVEAVVRKEVDRLAGSISIAMVHKDKIVYTYAYGKANPVAGIPADTQTIYQFGSMTKVFTASALMQLVEQGKVDLDAWPGKYIPGFPERWKVTVRQLLDHSACLPDEVRLSDGLIAGRGESLPPLKDVVIEYLKGNPNPVCEPGKVSNYANAHYLMLARIIEEVSGEPYETYVVDHILTPLAMQSTSFQLVQPTERYAKGQIPAAQIDKLVAQLNEYRGPGHKDLILQKGTSFATMDDFRILPPWGGLLGTPSDLTHFLQMYLNKGSYGNTQILKPETVATMQEMQKSTDGSPLGIGLSWWIGKDDFGKYYYHHGGGVTIETSMRYYPDLDLGVVVMGSANDYQADAIAEDLVSAWMNEK
jgi:CubicO group peptidase (beta-lactamase class C family)